MGRGGSHRLRVLTCQRPEWLAARIEVHLGRVAAGLVLTISYLMLWACGGGDGPPRRIVDAEELSERACPRGGKESLAPVGAYTSWLGWSRTPETATFMLDEGVYFFAVGIGPKIPSGEGVGTPAPGSRVSASMTLARETGETAATIINDELRAGSKGFTACRRLRVEAGEYRILVSVPAPWGVIVYR